MYRSISSADGPVDTIRFRKIRGYSFPRKRSSPSRKSSISALLVGKPFFFLPYLRALGLRDRE
jgi:hypothetical protein